MSASHIFICFSSKDETVARDVVAFLEDNGLECWISLRDVPPGENYQESIVRAIEESAGIVFLFSEGSSKSGEIRKELSIGGSINVPVFPLRLSPIAPTGAMRYELATRQYIDIFPDRDKALGKLAATIKKVVENPAAAADEIAAPVVPSPRAVAAPAKKRTRAPPRAPIVTTGSLEFEAIRVALARYIGPIAKILIEKASIEAKTSDEFCERLAAHVSAPADRISFVLAVRAQIAAKT